MGRRHISSAQLAISLRTGSFILRFAHYTSRHIATVACLALLVGCSGGSSNGNNIGENPQPAALPFQELYDQGIDRYLGKYSPMLSETEGDVVTHTFGSGDGPLCLHGAEYRMATRDRGASELMIFLSGGGYCSSAFCFVVLPNGEKGIPVLGVLDTALPGNPLASWNTVYLPYCDGGLHISDADSDSNGDGQIDRYQRGLRNLSAALDVAATTFPAPSRILLAGTSAGGFGASFALPLVRKLYPDVPINIINDSGVGLLAPKNPQYARSLFNEWNAGAFFPATCPSCIGDDGYLTDYYKWQLGHDANFRLGMLSFKQDSNLGLFGFASAEEFEKSLVEELSELEAANPQRMHSFLANGAAHTFLRNGIEIKNALQVTAGGVPAIDWVSEMLSGSADWVSTSD
jgi:Pectinacetylesterase